MMESLIQQSSVSIYDFLDNINEYKFRKFVAGNEVNLTLVGNLEISTELLWIQVQVDIKEKIIYITNYDFDILRKYNPRLETPTGYSSYKSLVSEKCEFDSDKTHIETIFLAPNMDEARKLLNYRYPTLESINAFFSNTVQFRNKTLCFLLCLLSLEDDFERFYNNILSKVTGYQNYTVDIINRFMKSTNADAVDLTKQKLLPRSYLLFITHVMLTSIAKSANIVYPEYIKRRKSAFQSTLKVAIPDDFEIKYDSQCAQDLQESIKNIPTALSTIFNYIYYKKPVSPFASATLVLLDYYAMSGYQIMNSFIDARPITALHLYQEVAKEIPKFMRLKKSLMDIFKDLFKYYRFVYDGDKVFSQRNFPSLFYASFIKAKDESPTFNQFTVNERFRPSHYAKYESLYEKKLKNIAEAAYFSFLSEEEMELIASALGMQITDLKDHYKRETADK